MILAALRGLAEREGIVEEPAFISLGVRWIIDIALDGRFLSLIDTTFLRPSSGKRKPRPQAKTMSIPRRSGRTSTAKAEFLVDKSEYVLGTLPAGEELNPARSQRFHQLFIGEMQAAQTKIQSPELEAALRFMSDPGERERCVTELHRQKFLSNDLFTFRVEGRFLHELDNVRAYWAEQKSAPRQKSKRSWQCLVCGEECQPSLRHEGIQLAGGGAHGVPLVSFGKAAFWKHGLFKGENAPVCRPCMLAYTTALRRLLRGYPNPKGGNFEQQSVVLTGDTTAVFWSQEASALAEQLPMLNEYPPTLEKLINSPEQASMSPETPFYCLILTGTIGRVIPRGMHTSTLGAVTTSLKLYFECLHASGYALETPPIHVLLRSLAVGWRLDRLSPGLAGEIFLAAVLGQRMTRRALAAAVGRSRVEQKVNRPRAAFLQFYFKLLLQKEFVMALDPESLDPAYRYGRLLAVLEGLEYSARARKPTSTIVDHFYGAASTRPAMVFPQLLGKAQDHLYKIKSKVVSRFKRQIEQIMGGLDGATGFRPTLNIEEQGRFALGYFHERAAHFSELENSQSGNVEPGNLTESDEEEQ